MVIDWAQGEAQAEGAGVRKLSRPKMQIVVLGAVLIAGVLGYRFVAHDRVDHPQPDPTEAADAVVVFAGGRGRLVKAQELMEADVSPVLVINHSVSSDDEPVLFAGACNDPALDYEVICIAATPSTTKGEAIAFADLADTRGWESLLAVTSDYHLERARFILSNCFSGDVRGDFDPSTYRWARSERETWELMATWVIGRGC